MALDAKKSAAQSAKPTPIAAGEPPHLPSGELPSGKPQVVVINGARMVMMPEADYNVLIEAARDNIEDLAAAADAIDILRRVESGEEETFPLDLLKSLDQADAEDKSRIKILRRYRGWTQAELGEAIGSDRLYISQLETGVRKGSADTLQKIAAVLGVSMDLIMRDQSWQNIKSKKFFGKRLDEAHVRNGSIRSSDSYGHDPMPPRDRVIARNAPSGEFVPVRHGAPHTSVVERKPRRSK